MLDDLENYEAAKPHLRAIDGHTIEAFVRDQLPELGTMLIMANETQQVVARVHKHLGGRLVQAHLLHDAPAWLKPNHPVSVSGQRAALPAHAPNLLDVREVDFVPQTDDTHSLYPTRPAYTTIDTDKTPMETAWPEMDLMCPVVKQGVTLVVDASDAGFETLVEDVRAQSWDEVVVMGCATRGTRSVIAGETTYGWFYALRAAMSWTASLRDEGKDILFVVQLPTLGDTEALARAYTQPGYGTQTPSKPQPRQTHQTILDELTEALPSTQTGKCTILARLPLGEHVRDMVMLMDTMSFGDVDTQLAIDEHSMLLLPNCRTRVGYPVEDPRAELRQRVLEAQEDANEIQMQLAIFGEDDCEAEDLERLALARRYEQISLER